MKLPENSKSKEDVYALLETYGEQDLPWREGGTFAYVYTIDAEMEALIKHAYMRYLTENGLDPTVYPSLLRFERDIVDMAANHLGSTGDVVGNFTSGGTESCMLACKTARDYNRVHKPHITKPEIVLPVTAHAAFHKACDYFDLTPVLVPVPTDSFRVEADAMRDAITENTILMVASAPQYAHGVIDPIEEIGALALERDLLFHVDGCVGAFMLPFFRRLGRKVPAFDFSVPGVSSMSMDFHKYAYAAKGASIVLYRDKDLRRHQIFTCADWTGYTVINNTIHSTKTGGPLAACWALLQYMGEERYLEVARKMVAGIDAVIDIIEGIPGLRILGDPQFVLVAFTADDFSVFPIVDEMRKLGWYVQPQLGFHGSKENIHLSIDQATIDRIDEFGRDLRKAVDVARTLSEPEGMDDLKALVGALTPETFTPEVFQQIMAASGTADGALPEGTAGINSVLNAVPAGVSSKILTEYFNELYIAPKDG